EGRLAGGGRRGPGPPCPGDSGAPDPVLERHDPAAGGQRAGVARQPGAGTAGRGEGGSVADGPAPGPVPGGTAACEGTAPLPRFLDHVVPVPALARGVAGPPRPPDLAPQDA